MLAQVPAAWSEHDRRASSHRVGSFALRAGVLHRAVDGVAQVDLALDHVLPRGGVGILVVREPHLGARVHRVDGHLAVRRSGDLDATVVESGARTRDAPRRVRPDRGRLAQEAEIGAAVDARRTFDAVAKAVRAIAGESAMQSGQEVQRLVGKDVLVAAAQAGRGSPFGCRTCQSPRTVRSRSSPPRRGSRRGG